MAGRYNRVDRDFETLTDELNFIMEAVSEPPKRKPCWLREDDFPDPPHWTTKVWRCAFKRSK